MMSVERQGATISLVGDAGDFKHLQKSVDRAADPDYTAQVVFRAVDAATGQHINLILRKGKSVDSL